MERLKSFFTSFSANTQMPICCAGIGHTALMGTTRYLSRQNTVARSAEKSSICTSAGKKRMIGQRRKKA